MNKMSKKFTGVILRSGEIVDAVVDVRNPPTPPDAQEGSVNSLLYCKRTSLLINGLFCEKQGQNHGDQKRATDMVRMRFKLSDHELGYILCESCAEQMVDQYAPYGNTGLTDNSKREEG